MADLVQLGIKVPASMTDVKVWARQVDAFIPARLGGYAIQGLWLSVSQGLVRTTNTKSGRVEIGASVRTPTRSTGRPVLVCISFTIEKGTFRVVFMVDVGVSRAGTKDKLNFRFGVPGGKVDVEAYAICEVVGMSWDAISPIAATMSVSQGIDPAKLEAVRKVARWPKLENTMRLCEVDRTSFANRSLNGVYKAAADLAILSMEKRITGEVRVLHEDKAVAIDNIAQEKKENKAVKSSKKGKPSYIYAGKNTARRKLKLPNNYVYAGSHLGLRMVAEQNHPDDGMPLYKMLDGLLKGGPNGVPPKDIPLWAAVMQEEIEKMEDMIAAMRISIVALTSKSE